MNRRTLAATGLSAVLLVGVGLSTAACTTTSESNKIGLYYMEGSYDGQKFDHVIAPGESSDTAVWNNGVYYLHTDLRTWNIGGEGSDQGLPLVVNTKAKEGEPSGVQVNVFTQTNFMLNTNDDDIEGYKGGTIRLFWERLGKRYEADTDKGWRVMLLNTVVPALEKSTQDVVREYEADQLIGNVAGVWTEVQTKISDRFLSELERIAGGKYFCGPDFKRDDPEDKCSAPQILLKNVDFTNGDIQKARDAKRAAVEDAARQLASAQGLLDTQAKLNQALKDPNYVRYLIAQIELQKVQECTKAGTAKCVLILGNSPVTVQTG